MARDYKDEYQKAKENGWRDGVKHVSANLTGTYVERYSALLELWDCKTLGEFLRKILDGKLIISKRF